jgi:O-glycosyl hydrolase
MKENHDITIDVLSLQNEGDEPKKWESCVWTEEEQTTFLTQHLAPRLEEDDVDIRIMANEHTMWNQDFKKLMINMMNDPEVSQHIDIVAGHRYRGPNATPFPQATENGKSLWMSEYYYEGRGDLPLNNARIVHNFLTKAEVNAYLFWWLVSNPTKKRQSLIQINQNNGTYTVSPKAYAFANFARCIRPGFTRIGMSAENLSNKTLLSAYKNAQDNTLVVVAINTQEEEKNITINFAGFTIDTLTPNRFEAPGPLNQLKPVNTNDDGKAFATALPPQSITTFIGIATPETPETP